MNAPSTRTQAPSPSRARKWVSKRRRPITSPPGGGRVTDPVRARRGPAKRIEARIFCANSGVISDVASPDALNRHTLALSWTVVTPRLRRISAITWTSSISGTARRTISSSVRIVAAMHVNAAFLFPDAVTDPLIGKPPSIMYLYNVRRLNPRRESSRRRCCKDSPRGASEYGIQMARVDRRRGRFRDRSSIPPHRGRPIVPKLPVQ